MSYESESGEMYSVADIRHAFREYAREDDWGVKNFYEESMIAALRGEYDEPEPAFEEYVTVDMSRGVAITHHENGSTTEHPLHPAFVEWMNNLGGTKNV